MVQCFKVNKELGSAVKVFLSEKGFLDRATHIGKTQRYLFFPVKKNANLTLILKEFKGTIESRNLEKVSKKGPLNLKDALQKVIPADKLEFLRRSFDVVGDIAILDIPPELQKLEKSIAWKVKQTFPHIKVVAKKFGKTSGVYRIRQIKVLQGEQRTSTIYKESGVRMFVDLNKVYFSPRLGSERLRISKQVKENEDILVLFAGVGPYALVIAKQHPSVKIDAIELNPDAIDLMKKNIRINYLGDQINSIKGDVKNVLPKLKKMFDRIIMVLPHKDEKFLPLTLNVAKKGAVIHMYAIAREGEFDLLKNRLEKEYDVKVKQIKKAGEYSPRVWRVCVDMVV